MYNCKPTHLRLPPWRDDHVLLGVLYLLTGFIVVVMGSHRIWQFWSLLEPELPFSLPSDIPDRIVGRLPHALAIFVNFVASLAGVLLGISWCLSGFAELLASRHRGVSPGPLFEPERIVELMLGAAKQRVGDALEPSCGHRSLSPTFPRLSLASKDIFYGLCRKIFKLLVILIVAKALFMVAEHLPLFVSETTQAEWALHVPSATPLYALIGIFIAMDAIMAVALFADKRNPLCPDVRAIQAGGSAHPLFLVSLLEESAAVNMARGAVSQTKWRLIEQGNPPCYGSLIESVQEIGTPRARLAAYPAMILSTFATALGFYSLMNMEFVGTFDSVGHFAAEAGLEYAGRVIFFVGVVILGGHLAYWAEAFLRLTSWASRLCLVVVWEKHTEANEQERPTGGLSQEGKKTARWALLALPHCWGDLFTPASHIVRQFGVAVLWASAYSESAAPSSRRILVGSSPPQDLDDPIDSIIEAAFLAHFDKYSPPPQ